MFGCAAAEAPGQLLERFIPARFRATHRAHVRGFATTGVTNRAMGKLGSLTALRADGREFRSRPPFLKPRSAAMKDLVYGLRRCRGRLFGIVALMFFPFFFSV